MSKARIKARERDTIIQALSAGVVPRVGLQHVQVGRHKEIEAAVGDVDRMTDGGAAVRFIIGEYGSGKTFFLHLVRLIALEKRFVTIHADLAPDRRIHATGGQARNLYAELVRNMATRAKPDGGALSSIVERFVADAAKEADLSGITADKVIETRLESLRDYVGGYDYATVLSAYWRAFEEGQEAPKGTALRWLRGEFSTKTDARNALGVRTIIDDASIYDHLKLLAAFVRLAGYEGLLIVCDEMVNLYKLQSAQARNANYEQILRIVNDALQGVGGGFGFYFGGTPEFLLDTRRGLYSYPALQSRLAENLFARDGLVDLSGPVVRLTSLTPEDLYVLLQNVRNVFAGGDSSAYLVPDEALTAFMHHCSDRIGESYFRTPRNTIKAFVQLLAILEQNPGAEWQSLLGHVEVAPDLEDGVLDEGGEEEGDDDLTAFRL